MSQRRYELTAPLRGDGLTQAEQNRAHAQQMGRLEAWWNRRRHKLPSLMLFSATLSFGGGMLAAVAVRNASGVLFTGCAFVNLGSAYALAISDESHDSAVRGCRFQALAGGALKLGNVFDNSKTADARFLSTDPGAWDSGREPRGKSINSSAASRPFWLIIKLDEFSCSLPDARRGDLVSQA